jgi:hypothetical protein
VDQLSGAPPTDVQPQVQDDNQPAAGDAATPPEPSEPGFGSRGRARRRVRFLRKARELAYRDLGGLVFNLHRFGQRNDALVLAKLNTVAKIDTEARTLEAALAERQAVTVLREAGITACARCAAIHSSEDRFCPNCGLSISRHVDLPIAGSAAPAAEPAAPRPPVAPVSPGPVVAARGASGEPITGSHPITGSLRTPPTSAATAAGAPPQHGAPPPSPSLQGAVDGVVAPGSPPAARRDGGEEATEIVHPSAHKP